MFTESNTVEQMILRAATKMGGKRATVLSEELPRKGTS